MKSADARKYTKKLTLSALFASLCLAATMFLAMPLPTGYANLGDGVAFICGFVLGMPWGMAAAGIGCALADLIGGYAVYMPATFVLKAVLAIFGAVAAAYARREPDKTLSKISVCVGASLIAEIFMVAGYFLFEYFILGVKEAALISVAANAGQGVIGTVLSALLGSMFIKNHKLANFIDSI